jgi:hypothetical protein
MIGTYPDLTELTLADHAILDPLLRQLREGVSELTFAGIYCFREPHGYRIARLPDGTIFLAGSDKGVPFFVCPFALPSADWLAQLFTRFSSLKLATEAQADQLRAAGYQVDEDRDNFDYIYRREDLAALAGRALQKKRNLVNFFVKRSTYQAHPLTPDRVADALAVLEAWRDSSSDLTDYAPAREALLHATEFSLQGQIYYVEGAPAGYTLGETVIDGTMLVVHYEKTIPNMKGLSQVINMDFVRAQPATCTLINREQDLGDPGLRQAKLTYRPCAFVKKYRVRRATDNVEV